ncbi:MAG: cadherin-like beta sandwich domain-containing protein [Acholeplasmatales bacterium]|nr:cadherin-like beta sandwich domain-containing protein [Acholeplasmatales bacterium]
MRKLKIKLSVTFLLVLASFAALFSSFFIKDVYAAGASSIAIDYKTYEASKFDTFNSFKTNWNALFDSYFGEGMGYDLSGNNAQKNQARNAINGISWTNGFMNIKDINDLGNSRVTVNYPYDASTTADYHAYWDWSDSDPDNWIYLYDDNGDPITDAAHCPHTLLGGYPEDFLDSDGQLLSQYSTLAETSEFAPNNSMVVAVYMTMTGADFSGGHVRFDISSYSNTVEEYYVADEESITPTKTGPAIGWQYTNSANTSYTSGDKVYVGAIKIKLDNISNGQATIQYDKASSYASATAAYDSAGTSYNVGGGLFSEPTGGKKITVIGQSNSTTVQSIDIAGTSYPVGSSGSPDIQEDTVTIGTDNDCKSYSLTGTSSSPIYVSGSSFTLDATIADLGTITAIKYGDTIANAYNQTGTKSGIVSGSAPYSIPLTGFGTGDTVVVLAEVTASDGTTTKWVNINVTKQPDTVAILEGATINITGPTSTTVTTKQANSSYTDLSGTSFSSSVYYYNIYIPSDTTSLSLTPTFDVANNHHQTCEVDGIAKNSGAIANITTVSNGTIIDVVMTAQDEVTTKTYHFKINHVSTVTDLVSLAYTSGTQTGNATYNSSTKTYTISGIKFANASVTLTPTFPTNAQGWEYDGQAMDKATKVFTFPAAAATNYAAYTAPTVQFVVTAQAGNTETYNVVVERAAADNDKAITSVQIKYTDPVTSTLQTVNATLSGTTYTVSNVPYKVSSYQVVVNLHNTTLTQWDIGGTKHASGADESVNFVANAGNAVTSSKTLTITPEYQTDTATFNLEVERLAADTNTLLDGLTITSNTGDSYGTFDATTQTFTIADSGNYKFPYSATSATVTPYITGLSKVQVKEGTTVLSSNQISFSGINDDSHSISIVITPEYGTPVTIPVTVVRGGADNHTEFELTVTASQNQIASGDTSVSTTSTTSPYTYNVDYGTASVQIDIAAFTDATHNTQSTSTKFYLDNVGTLMTGNTLPVTFNSTIKTQQTQNVDIYFYTSAYPYLNSSSTYAKKITVKVVRAAADNNTTITWDITNTSGATATSLIASVTDSSVTRSVTSNTHSFTIDTTSTENGFTDGKFKISASATKATTKIYWSDDLTNLTQNELSSSDEFAIGSYPTVNIIYLTAESQMGTKVTYTIKTCTPDNRNPDNKITNITLDNYSDYTFSSTVTNVPTITVPYTTSTMIFTVTKNVNVSKMTYKVDSVTKGSGLGAGSATATTATINLTAGATTKVEIFLTAERDNIAGSTYTFNIKRDAGSTANYLTSASINGVSLYTQNNVNVLAPYSQASNNMVFVVDSSVTSANFEFEVSPKAKYYLSDTTNSYTANGFTDTTPATYNGFGLQTTAPTVLTLTVYSEVQQGLTSPTGNTYTIYVYAAKQNHAIDNIELYKDSTMADYIFDTADNIFDYSQIASYTSSSPFTVSFSGNSATYVNVETPAGANSKVYVNGGANYDVSLPTSLKKITVKVVSQLGELLGATSSLYNDQVTTYDFYVKRNAASTVSTLDTLVVTGGGNTLSFKEGAFASGTKTYHIENLPDTITQIEFTYTKTDSRSTTTASTTPYVFTDLSDTKTESITITVYSEDAQDKIANGLTPTTTSTYEVIFSRKPVVLDTNNELTNIVAYDVNAKYYIGGTSTQPFSPSAPAYSVNLDASIPSVSFIITKPTNKSTLAATESDGVTSVSLIAAGKEKDPTNSFVVSVDPGKSKTVTLTITAEDTTVTPNTYTITINRADYEDVKELASLSYNGIAIGLITGKYSYTVKVPNSVEDVYLDATTKSAKAEITSNDAPQSAPVALTVGVNPSLSIVVKSEKGNTQPYTVTFERDEVATLDDLKLTDSSNVELVDGDGNKYLVFDNDPAASKTYSVTVPYDVSSVNLVPTLAASDSSLIKVTYTGSTINQLGHATLSEGLNTFKITLTPNSGINPQVYTVEITRTAGNSDNFIETYKYYANAQDKADGNLTELEVNRTDTEYSYSVSKDVLVFEPEITVSEGATLIMPTNLNIIPGTKNVFNVDVKSQKGVTKNYKFNVYSANKDFDITDINVLDKQGGTDVTDINTPTHFVDYQETTISYNLAVAYSTKNVYLEVLPKDASASIMISKDNGLTYTAYSNSIQGLDEGTNTFKVYAISEYGKLINDGVTGKSQVYTITITRNEADGDSRVDELKITYGGTVYTWDATLDDDQVEGTSAQYAINIPNIGDTVTQITIAATPTSNAAKVTGIGLKTLEDLAGSGSSVTGYIFNFTVEVTSEKGNVNKYNITLSRGPLDLDNDNTINYISLVDSQGTEYIGEARWNSASLRYEVTIPYGPTSYQIKVVKPNASPSTITGDGQFQITFPTTGNYEKTHTVFATSANGTAGTKYTIVVTAVAPSADASLKEIIINGSPIVGFDKDVLRYTAQTLDNSVRTISVAATPTDPKATVIGDIGQTIFIYEGNNQIGITVIAQDNKTTRNYVVNVPRDYQTPYLTDLQVAGEQLLDTLDKATTFDKDTLTYHATVSYVTLKATINASVDNTTHTVSTTNSTVIQNAGVTRQFDVTLNEGANTYKVVVSSTAGKSKEYTLVITRRAETSTDTSVTGIKLTNPLKPTEQIAIDFDPAKQSYDITVENKISDINIEATLGATPSATGAGATYQVLNNTNLKSGEQNKVVVLVTAEDGETTRAILFNVTRKPMEFTVNKEAYAKYTTTALNEASYKYQITLGEEKAKDIADYTKYIVPGEGCDLDVTVLSDTTKADCKEVVVKVTDGYDEEFVTFTLDITEPPASNFDYIVWILLGLGLIILIIILILVNKDKFGSVSKKRKKA